MIHYSRLLNKRQHGGNLSRHGERPSENHISGFQTASKPDSKQAYLRA
ncbi:hypothetical protein [Neisseria elongata]|nr:hypothetical protein [Neisseria elongata]